MESDGEILPQILNRIGATVAQQVERVVQQQKGWGFKSRFLLVHCYVLEQDAQPTIALNGVGSAQ